MVFTFGHEIFIYRHRHEFIYLSFHLLKITAVFNSHYFQCLQLKDN